MPAQKGSDDEFLESYLVDSYIKKYWPEDRLNELSDYSGWHNAIKDIIREVWHASQHPHIISEIVHEIRRSERERISNEMGHKAVDRLCPN